MKPSPSSARSGRDVARAFARARAAVKALPEGEARDFALAALEGGEKPIDESREARKRAYAEYVKTHWGAPGSHEFVESRCADPRGAILVKLGRLCRVEYEATKRGDPPRTLYQHDFSRPFPDLAYSTGGLVIVGGGYTVTKHGIER